MTQKNKNLATLLLIVILIILAIYGRAQNWLPLKIGNNPKASVTEKPIEQDISVSLEVNTEKYQTKARAGTTAYDLMNNLKATQGLRFKANDYPGLGSLVEEINGVKNDVKANKYWFYYINGKSANEGVTSYVLKNNDVITWKYEESKF